MIAVPFVLHSFEYYAFRNRSSVIRLQDETNLKLYEDAFDIVLVDDQTMDVPRAIVDHIVQQVEGDVGKA